MAKKKGGLAELRAKIEKANKLDQADILSDSKFFIDEFHDTKIPALNVALSARLDGGFSRGSTLIAGDSKTFKTMFMLQLAKAYMDENPESMFVFYDVEFGTNNDSMKKVGIDTTRVFHKPLTNVDELSNDISNLLEDLDLTDDVFIGIDSLGAIASKKEQDDAMSGSDKTDMTRAKKIKSFWRIVNPYINKKNIPLVAIGQTYSTQEFISKEVVGGGKGMEYFPNNIWMITKAQIKSKDKKDFLGSTFTVNIHKARLVRERSKFPVTVTYEGGIDKYSALLDIALDLGYVVKGEKLRNSFRYHPVGKPELNSLLQDTSRAEFWDELLVNEEFKQDVYDKYALGSLKHVKSTGEVVENGMIYDESTTEKALKTGEIDADALK